MLTHTHATGEPYECKKSRNDCQVSCPQWAVIREACGHFPLSCAASLLTWSQSLGVMELEKVINPALQRGQDSSIKPVQKEKDSSIFNYCFQTTGGSLKAALLSARKGLEGPRSQQLLSSTLRSHMRPVWQAAWAVGGYVQSIYTTRVSQKNKNKTTTAGKWVWQAGAKWETGSEESGIGTRFNDFIKKSTGCK